MYATLDITFSMFLEVDTHKKSGFDLYPLLYSIVYLVI